MADLPQLQRSSSYASAVDAFQLTTPAAVLNRILEGYTSLKASDNDINFGHMLVLIDAISVDFVCVKAEFLI